MEKTFGFEKELMLSYLRKNKFNNATATYYLSIKKKQRLAVFRKSNPIRVKKGMIEDSDDSSKQKSQEKTKEKADSFTPRDGFN